MPINQGFFDVHKKWTAKAVHIVYIFIYAYLCLLSKQMFPNLYHISSAHGDYKISWAAVFQ